MTKFDVEVWANRGLGFVAAAVIVVIVALIF
ncbi:hypothetical protein SAMN04515695_3337 [Pseudovibrio sp. Tun.PSC04-5.I4]|nr:hypothetical protein SAMN04515695_3337 [Pseudovibrio sp. Tun.PSC04-5.I4]